MIALHEATLGLLTRMYDPPEFHRVLEHIEEFYLSYEGRGYPFLVLQFGSKPLGEIPVDDPPESYIWN